MGLLVFLPLLALPPGLPPPASSQVQNSPGFLPHAPSEGGERAKLGVGLLGLEEQKDSLRVNSWAQL